MSELNSTNAWPFTAPFEIYFCNQCVCCSAYGFHRSGQGLDFFYSQTPEKRFAFPVTFMYAKRVPTFVQTKQPRSHRN